MKTVMQHQFERIPKAETPRSKFDLSYGYKTTFNSGALIPFFHLEALPGDTLNVRTAAFSRLATPIKPFMDNLHMETFYFSVPVRQVWDNWEKFNGEQTDPADSTDFLVPKITHTPWAAGSLGDYFGLPVDPIQCSPNALFFRAYNHIFNNWFRDQNLIDSAPHNTGDGPDVDNNYLLKSRRKRPDYFTSCLPWPQKGAQVLLPLGEQAPVAVDSVSTVIDLGIIDGDGNERSMSTDQQTLQIDQASSGGIPMYADLTNATAATINELREAFQIQRLLERDARGGTRYPEILKSHWNVTDPQMLVLQRPEFLGGGSTRINVNPVAQTTPDETLTPQGNLAAFGTGSFQGHGFTKSFTEHCLIIGIINVRADLTYQQGMQRHWNRQTRFDFYWPALAHLGEQEVLNGEIYHQNSPGQDEGVFGYQERYAEYRFTPSMITGEFRSTHPQSLDVWHLSQEFGSLPVLGETFITDKPPIDRVIAVPSEPEFLLDAYHQVTAARAMPIYSVPGLIDHF